MKIIAIEGLDHAGKATAATTMKKELEKLGKKVIQSEFHRYDTPTGHLIQEWLYGRYDVSDRTIELIMLADKEAQQDWFKELDKNGTDYLILDRYLASEQCYAGAKMDGGTLDLIDEGQRSMRDADETLYLTLSPETSMKRKGKHGDNDRYEADLEFLTRVKREFDDWASCFKWRKIDAEQDIDSVQKEVKEYVEWLVELENK